MRRLGGGDVGFAVDDGAVVHAGGEGDVGVGGGVDAAAGGEDLRRHLHGLGEVAGDVERAATKRLPKEWPSSSPWLEAELEEFGEEVLVFGEGDHAVADVAGGSILKSSRSRPEEPPSSVTVTMAARSRMRQGRRCGAGCR